MEIAPERDRLRPMSQDKIQEIEMLLAHQERQIQDLSDMIALQGKEISMLKTRLDRTQKKLVEMEAGGGADQGESLSVSEQAARDKPPHY